MQSLSGKVALVTGASRGIGPYIARALAEQGATIVAVARGREGLDATCAEIERSGGHAHAVPADLSDPRNVADLVDRARTAAGRIDILVNNAGVEYYRRFHEYSAKELATVLTVNLHVPLELARQLLPSMLQRGEGHIVGVASLAGKKGVSFNAPYSATKAGMILWTDAVREELEGTPVGVSVVVPGYIHDAGMFHDGGVAPPKLLGSSSPQDVADAVVEAIRSDAQELIVNPRPVRAMLALGQLSPSLAHRVVQWMGVGKLNAQRRDRES
jgi:short-subunit dehydrogenase